MSGYYSGSPNLSMDRIIKIKYFFILSVFNYLTVILDNQKFIIGYNSKT